MNPLRACLSVSGIFLLAALFGAAPPVHAQGDASRATPPPGKALVFVFRSDRQPVAAQVPVVVNLVRIGDLTDGTFAVATVNPGRTFLRIGEQALAVFTLEAVANRSYFVRVEATLGERQPDGRRPPEHFRRHVQAGGWHRGGAAPQGGLRGGRRGLLLQERFAHERNGS